MPSIEIICIDQKSLTRFSSLSFVVKSEKKLVSHRIPSLFQKDLDKLKGCIYHLGCRHLRYKRIGAFEAYDLLSRKCRKQERMMFLEFNREVFPDVKRVIIKLIKMSPISKVLFTSDYQFSSNKPKRVKSLSLQEFWKLYKNRRLRFNTLYEIINLPTA